MFPFLPSTVTQSLLELHTKDFVWKFYELSNHIRESAENTLRWFFCENGELHLLKQDQGSKAPSRDHPNSSFMTRLDYIRVED